jgi:starvation-inducible DNA-binding protein
MKANIGISDEHTQKAAQKLNQILADEFVLYSKVRNCHWNIEGSNFMEMHKFYEGMYKDIEAIIDEIAERVRMLGHYAEGRLKDFLALTNLLEEEYTNNQKKQLENLLSDHETLIRNLRNDINIFTDEYKDLGNAEFLTGLLIMHEKWAWFVRSYLK